MIGEDICFKEKKKLRSAVCDHCLLSVYDEYSITLRTAVKAAALHIVIDVGR